MQVVDAVDRIEILRPRVGREFFIHLRRAVVAPNHALIVAAKHVDVGGHVHQMPRVGDQIDKPVAVAERQFRPGRHFHKVDIKMQEAGMVPGRRVARESGLENRADFGGRSAFGGRALLEVPKRPWGAVHHRLGKDRRHVQIARVGRIDGPHGLGEGIVPGSEVLDLGVGRKARGQGCNHGALDVRQIAQSRGGGQRRPRFFQRSDPLVGLEYLPFLVVVWPNGMGEAPIGHAGTRVCGNRFAKTFGRFFVIKAE